MNRTWNILTILFSLLAGLSWSAPVFAEAQFIESNITLKVQKKEQVADALVAKAVEFNGYFANRSDYELFIKIPVAHVDEYLVFVENQGLIAGRSFQSESRSQEIADLEARLKTREELLQKYFQILENAGSANVVTVENEVIRLITEIESLKGRLRKQQHMTTYADIHIEFRFKDRRAPVSDGSSSFDWINTLNVQNVQAAFQYNYDAGTMKSKGVTPSDFAVYSKGHKDIMATSQDQVIYRIRTLKPKPTADNAFWAEAVSRRMGKAGYHAYENEEIAATAMQNGYVVKCMAPNGSEDLTYWIAFAQQGRTLTIIEAMGESSTFELHRDAIEQAMSESLQ